MSKKLYIADTHFGHENIIRFDDRPFNGLDEMHTIMIDKWNAVVRPDDDVFIAGDFAYKLKPNLLRVLSGCLNGRKHLAWGNHDKRNEDLYMGFVEFGDLLVTQDYVGNTPVRVVISHYYMPFFSGARLGSYLMYGHTHKGTDYDMEERIKQQLSRLGLSGPAYNVGCMHQYYYPMTLEQIVDRKKKEEELRKAEKYNA